MCPQTLRQALGHSVVKNKQYHASWTHEIEFWKRQNWGPVWAPWAGQKLNPLQRGISVHHHIQDKTYSPSCRLKKSCLVLTAKYQNGIIFPSFFTYCFKILRHCGHTSVVFYTCAAKRHNFHPSVETLQSTFLLLISNDPLFSSQSCHFWRLYSKSNELSHSSHAAVLELRKISTTLTSLPLGR